MKAKLFNQLIESVKEAKKIIRGEIKPSRVFEIKNIDVKDVRKKTGLSQTDFAMTFGIPCKTLKNWEQHLRTPTGAALALLMIIKNDPEHALKALHV